MDACTIYDTLLMLNREQEPGLQLRSNICALDIRGYKSYDYTYVLNQHLRIN